MFGSVGFLIILIIHKTIFFLNTSVGGSAQTVLAHYLSRQFPTYIFQSRWSLVSDLIWEGNCFLSKIWINVVEPCEKIKIIFKARTFVEYQILKMGQKMKRLERKFALVWMYDHVSEVRGRLRCQNVKVLDDQKVYKQGNVKNHCQCWSF